MFFLSHRTLSNASGKACSKRILCGEEIVFLFLLFSFKTSMISRNPSIFLLNCSFHAAWCLSPGTCYNKLSDNSEMK